MSVDWVAIASVASACVIVGGGAYRIFGHWQDDKRIEDRRTAELWGNPGDPANGIAPTDGYGTRIGVLERWKASIQGKRVDR